MSYEFPREVLKIVVAQICHGFDFKAIEQSAHDALTDILAACTLCATAAGWFICRGACKTQIFSRFASLGREEKENLFLSMRPKHSIWELVRRFSCGW